MTENNPKGKTLVFPFSCTYQFAQDDEENTCTGFDETPFMQYCNEQGGIEIVNGVSTQTDRLCCLNVLSEDEGTDKLLTQNNIEKINIHGTPNDLNFSPLNKTKTSQSGSKKERTPRTMKRMMEKHRENERVRHHTLNQSMKKVCQRVPGFVDDNKETKVVMMQRVITYICYLENTIFNLSEELGIKLDLASGFRRLASKMRKQKRASPKQETSPANRPPHRRNFLRQHSGANSRWGRIKQEHTSHVETDSQRRLKVSSPTIDSTTSDFMSHTSCSSEFHSPGTSTACCSSQPALTSTVSSADYKVFLSEDENFDSNNFIHQQGDMSSLFPLGDSDLEVVSSTLLCDDFDENNISLASPKSATFDLICSPGKSNSYTTILADKENIDGKLRGKMMKNECSRQRYNSWEMTDADMQSIPPEAVLQTKFAICASSPPKRFSTSYRLTNNRGRINSAPDPQNESIVNNKSKKATDKSERLNRSPLQDISNSIKIKEEMSDVDYQSAVIGSPESDTFVTLKTENQAEADEVRQLSGFPFIWKFPESTIKRYQQRDDIDSFKGNSENSEGENRGEEKKSQKIDHRKTSWMNGFMMFSRMNRRRFISANPGVHTSNISKIMGQSWRNMTDNEQNPYKEKAKKYAAYMQSVYEDGSPEIFDFGFDFSPSSEDITTEISSSPVLESDRST